MNGVEILGIPGVGKLVKIDNGNVWAFECLKDEIAADKPGSACDQKSVTQNAYLRAQHGNSRANAVSRDVEL